MDTDKATAQLRASAALLGHVPELARTWQAESPGRIEQERPGTLVFADISGFTRLTERLAARGRIGAEEMSDYLDRVLSELLAAAYDHSGWLVKWGGDALLLMFDRDDHAALACGAAVAMQSTIRRVGKLDASVGRVRLRMSIGIETGRFTFHLLGNRHRELFITGEDVTTAVSLEATADAGEILISPRVAATLPYACRGDRKDPGILLARAPAVELSAVPILDPATVDAAGLIPELVLHHLRSGGGSGEHRPVAVAFLEFSGLSALRAEQGGAAVTAGLQRLVEVTQDACHRNTVSFHETDISADAGKIMLVAGAPRALEDPAEAMLCTLRQILDEPGALPLRAGVTTGRVFTGAVGPPWRRSYSVKGDVVNLAARIMGKTAIGEIWALPAVVDASRTKFATTDISPFTVKGKKAAVVVRAVGPTLARVDARPNLRLVGRVDEMTVLSTLLDRVRSGRGSHVDLVGEAGIGKTRLLTELQSAAADLPVVAVAAEPYRAASSYSLAKPLLLRALGLADEHPAEQAKRLAAWCDTHAPTLVDWLPLLGPLLGTAVPETARTRDLAPEFRVERLQILVFDLLRAALPGPSVLIADDVQFADDASEGLLAHLASRVDDQSWLIVLSGRAVAGDERTDGAARLATSLRVELGPLSPADSLALTHSHTDDDPLPPHVTAAVVERGGGNPLFLRQLASAAHSVADAADLPDSIESVVAARIDQLRPTARELLRAAAVIGMSVDRSLLRELTRDYPVAPDDVLAELGEFVATDTDALRFRQAMIRDAAYEGLAFRHRAELHGRLADLLVAGGSTDVADIDAILSLHYLHAGRHEQALTSAAVAAESAAAVYANADAAILYARALTAAEQIGSVDADVRAGLLERLGDVQVLLGEYEAGDRSYTAACRLLTGQPHALAAIGLKRARSADRRAAYGIALSRLSRVGRTLRGLNDPEARAARLEMRMRMAFTQFRQGRLLAARHGCLSVLETGDERRNAATVADALALLDIVDVQLGVGGDDERARHAVRLLETSGDLAGQARVWTQIGYRAYLAGQWNDAVAANKRARELFERRGDESNVAIADSNLAEIMLDQGRLDDAEVALRNAIRVWRASGSDNDTAFASALLGRVLARQARYDEAAELIAKAREQFEAHGAQTEVVDADAYEAERLLLSGDIPAAAALAELTLNVALQQSAQPVQGSLLNRILGGCHDAEGDWAAGSTAYARALDLARRRGAAHDLLFTVTAMARRRRLGGPAVDPALLSEVAPLGGRLGVVVDLTTVEQREPSPDDLPRQRQSEDETVRSQYVGRPPRSGS